MKTSILLLFCVVALLPISSPLVVSSMPVSSPKCNSMWLQKSNRNRDSIFYKIISGSANTYGYDIYKNDRLIIHQPSIPGRNGSTGFRKKEEAEKVAGLVIRKIRMGEMPPTIRAAELKELGISD